jgi:hypothetical protein
VTVVKAFPVCSVTLKQMPKARSRSVDSNIKFMYHKPRIVRCGWYFFTYQRSSLIKRGPLGDNSGDLVLIVTQLQHLLFVPVTSLRNALPPCHCGASSILILLLPLFHFVVCASSVQSKRASNSPHSTPLPRQEFTCPSQNPQHGSDGNPQHLRSVPRHSGREATKVT